MNTRRAIFALVGLGGIGALLAGHLGLADPTHIAVGAAYVAGGITVLTSAIAAFKSMSTDRKVDAITILVDGRYSDVLKELSDVRRLLAEKTGLATDRMKADAAQMKSEGQAARVETAERAGKV